MERKKGKVEKKKRALKESGKEEREREKEEKGIGGKWKVRKGK